MLDQAERLRQLAQEHKHLTHSTKQGQLIKQNQTVDKQGPRVIAVTSGKGGVGKTNFTVNLALALAELNQKVFIFDADLGLANVDVVLGLSCPYHLLHWLERKKELAEIIVTGPKGIKIMSGGSGILELADLPGALLQQIIQQISWLDSWADIILVDTGAGIHKNVLQFVMAADEVILITTPEPTALTDAYALIKSFVEKQGQVPVQLIVNRVYDKAQGKVVAQKLQDTVRRFLSPASVYELGYVYEDRSLYEAVCRQTPVFLAYPNAASSSCIREIAKKLIFHEKIAQPRGIKGFFSKILDKIW